MGRLASSGTPANLLPGETYRRAEPARSYVGRVIAFHFLWVALYAALDVLLVISGATGASTAPEYYRLLAPLSFAVFAVASLPVTILAALGVWRLAVRTRHPRLVAVLCAVGAWAVVVLVVGVVLVTGSGGSVALTLPSARTLAQTAAIVLLGLLMPLPDPPNARH